MLALTLVLATSVFILITFYKKELATTLIENLKENQGMILKIEDLNVSFFSNWPDASIQLKNISVSSNLSPNKNEPILQAGSVALSLDILKLFKKQFSVGSVSIKNAKINLIKNKDGSNNFELKQTATKSSASPIEFEIKKITILNTQFNFLDKEKGQDVDVHFVDNVIKLKNEQDGIEAKIMGEVNIGGLMFKPEKGPFLKNTTADLNLSISIFTKSNSVFIHQPSIVTMGNHPYYVTTFIDLKEKKQLVLSIQSENIDYKKGMSLLNTNLQKKLANFNVNKNIDAKILIIASLGIKQDPIIIAQLSGKNNDVTIGNSKIPYSNLSFYGTIVSLDSSRQKGDTEHARVIFKSITGNLYDFPFTASVTVVNFDDPQINIDANLFITATKINFKPGKDFILKGNCIAKIKYSGPTKKLNKNEFLDAPMKLEAGLFFNDLSYQEINKPYVYTIVGNANLKNKDLQFENLFLKTDAGNVTLKGDVKNFTSYVLGFTQGFKATLSARSESFNLNPYLSVKANKKDSAARKTEAAATAETTKAYKKTIKAEQSNFEFNVSLLAKKMFVRNVKATNASINLVYKNKLLDVRSVNMNACNGKLFAKGTIYDLNKITAEVKIEDMDVNSLFSEFENFGQKAIESEHLQGNIFVDAKIKTELDEKMEVIGNTMDGEIKVKLTEGHLLNFQPLQNISDYIFRNRDFKDISFSEINQTCQIKGFEMQIEEMEIASNVLNLFVSGTYHFKENSNINILVPWSNLKKRGKNYIPVSSGQTAENSKGLKLNYSGPPKKLKLSLGHK